VIAASTLLPRFADKLCVVTPRGALQQQMERNFQEDWLRQFLGHKHEVRQATNDADPSRKTSGYVTTYQALASDSMRVNLSEFRRHRYVLILDEMHHLDDGGSWHRAIQPLVDAAAFVILMSGTLERGDSKRIALLPYKECISEYGRTGECVDEHGGMPVIRYTRGNALEEQAVKPLLFEHLDGSASWMDREGQDVDDVPLSLAGKRTNEALYTVLRTDYARQLLERCVSDWMAYRRINKRAKLLVVAATIPSAKQCKTWLRELGVDRAEIATSEDSAEALKVIDRYAKHDTGSLDALVTVAMAYEGLDNPSITHVACLTHIRSRPWIEQMISRANRVDRGAGTYDSQSGWIYGPDDVLLNDILDQVRIEQAPFLAERDERTKGPGGDKTNTADPIVPKFSVLTHSRASGLEGGELDRLEMSIYTRALDESGLRGVIHPLQFATAVANLNNLKDTASFANMPTYEPTIQRPSDREKKIKDAIDAHCKRWDYANERDWGTLNKQIVFHFGKRRGDMTEDELKSVWTWINAEYPLTSGA